jgi:hypothetical protein
MNEAITGPFRGLYVAARSCPLDAEGEQYLGYYKVYPSKPASYADPGCIAEAMSKARFPSPEVALHHAGLKGIAAVERLAAHAATA